MAMTREERIALLTSPAAVEGLQQAVVARARWYTNEPGAGMRDWSECLELAAKDICPDWEWLIAKFVGATLEDANFFLTVYIGDD